MHFRKNEIIWERKKILFEKQQWKHKGYYTPPGLEAAHERRKKQNYPLERAMGKFPL